MKTLPILQRRKEAITAGGSTLEPRSISKQMTGLEHNVAMSSARPFPHTHTDIIWKQSPGWCQSKSRTDHAGSNTYDFSGQMTPHISGGEIPLTFPGPVSISGGFGSLLTSQLSYSSHSKYVQVRVWCHYSPQQRHQIWLILSWAGPEQMASVEIKYHHVKPLAY